VITGILSDIAMSAEAGKSFVEEMETSFNKPYDISVIQSTSIKAMCI